MDDLLMLLQAKLDEAKSKGNVNADIKELQSQLDKLKVQVELDPKSITNIVKQLESALGQKIKLPNISVDSKIGQQIGNNIGQNIVDGISKSSGKVNAEVQKIANQVNKIQLSMEGKNTKSKNYDYQIDTEIKKLKDLGFTDEEVAQKVKILTDAQSELKRVMDSSDFDSITSKNKAIIESDKERTTALNQVRTAYGQLKNDATQYYNLNKQSKLSTDIQNWLSKNSRASKEAKESLNAYYRELSGGRVSVDRLNYIEKELKDIDATQRGLGKLGKNLKDQFKEAGASFTQWLSVSSGIMALVYQLQKIPKEVIAVNKAMVELTKVSDASSSDIAKYFDEAAKSAKNLGSSVSDVINATADFSRLGYSLPEASELAKVATLYKNVGDGIDINEASSSLVSTMKAFNITAEDSISIIDKLNEVGNNFSISSGEIGEALKRSASSLSVAGNTLSESIGLITAGNTVAQDADMVGTALKTMSLRITSTSAELSELGEDTEFACETLSDYRDLVMGLTHNKVDIIGDTGDYKSTFLILQEISKVWEDMNSMEQSSLMKALFGVRQANIGSSILENFNVAEEAMKSAEEAAGSALKEQEAYEKGIQYSLDRLEASFQTFANHILKSNFLKGIIDFGNGTIEVINKVTSKLGSLGTIGLGAGLFAGIRNVGGLKYREFYFINVFC